MGIRRQNESVLEGYYLEGSVFGSVGIVRVMCLLVLACLHSQGDHLDDGDAEEEDDVKSEGDNEVLSDEDILRISERCLNTHEVSSHK